MKNLVLILILILITFSSIGQTVPFGSSSSAGIGLTQGRIKATYYANTDTLKFLTTDATGLHILRAITFPTPVDTNKFVKYTDSLIKYVTPTQAASLYVPLTRTLTIQGVTQSLAANRTWSFTTTDIPEGTNLYFTQARARQSISVTGGLLSYDNSTGVIGLTNATLNGSYWSLGGNATSSTQAMGTTTAQPFTFMTNNLTRGTVASNGTWTLGSSALNIETILALRNDQTARILFDIGRNATFSAKQMAITFDQTGGGTSFTRVSSLASDMSLQGNTISLQSTSAASTAVLLGGDISNLGGLLRVSVRRPWFAGIPFAPTSGTTVGVSWENNGSSTNYIPPSGTNRFIWSRFNPVIAATGTYAGSVEGFVFEPTLTSIASGTVKAFVSNHNVGRALSMEGTAINVLIGRALFGTTTDDMSSQVQVNGVTKTTNLTITGVAEYADNAAAISAGLPVGRIYRTGDNLKIVH
jgi:hypothetical protein